MSIKDRRTFFLMLFAMVCLLLPARNMLALGEGGVPNSIDVVSFHKLNQFKALIQGTATFSQPPQSIDAILLDQPNSFTLTTLEIVWLVNPCNLGQQCETSWRMKTDLGVPDGEYELIVFARMANGTVVIDQANIVVGDVTGPDCGSGICAD